MFTINYKGKLYKAFEVNVDGFGNRVVAEDSLCRVLLDEDEKYPEDAAQRLDEKIFFYVDSSISTDAEAQEYVNKNVV